MSRSSYIDECRAAAEEAFAGHAVVQTSDGPIKQWVCARPGTGNHSFRVTVWPRTIVISGDTGDAIFEISDLDPMRWIDGKLGWDYVLSKSRTKQPKVFSEGALREMFTIGLDRGGFSDGEIRSLLIASNATTIDELIDGADDSDGDTWHDIVRESDLDDLGDVYASAMAPNAEDLRCVFALIWFGRWLDRQRAEEKQAAEKIAVEHDAP